jgi:hypothetical protein
VTSEHHPWHIVLRRKIVWLLVIKFFALLVLWTLFFSPAHRDDVTSERSAEHLALDQGNPAP